MKKLFLILLAAATLFSCSEIENPGAEFDFAKYLGQDLASVKAHFGASGTEMNGMIFYQFASGEVSMLTFMADENNSVMMISAEMRESAKPADDIKAYFAKTYKTTGYEDETVYADNTDINKASFYISVGEPTEEGTYFVYYISTNTAGGDEGEALELDADSLIKTFMGMSESDFDDYSDCFTCYQGIYMAEVIDDMVSTAMLLFEEGTVASVTLMAEESEDEDIAAYFDGLEGYSKVSGDLILYNTQDNDGKTVFVRINDGMVFATYTQPGADDED